MKEKPQNLFYERKGNKFIITINQRLLKKINKKTKEIKFIEEPVARYHARLKAKDETMRQQINELNLIGEAYDDNFERMQLVEKNSIEHQKLLIIENALNDRGKKLKESLRINKFEKLKKEQEKCENN